jgi:hypothetical protein
MPNVSTDKLCNLETSARKKRARNPKSATPESETQKAKTSPKKKTEPTSNKPTRNSSTGKLSGGITKQERVLTLLSRRQGASIEDIVQETDWQKHSVRGFLAGIVKKKLGLALTSSKDKNKARRDRIEPPIRG